jgi:hypothetical protein
VEVNPYESPKTSAEPQPVSAPDALRTAILKMEPWATLAGVAVLISGLVVVVVMIIGGPTGQSWVPVVVLAVGSGILASRLLLLGRSVRAAAAVPARLGDCFGQLRRVFSYTGILAAIYLGLIVIGVIALLIFVK